MGPLKRQSDHAIAAEAAEWHVRHGQMSNQDQEAFAAWLKESPRHVREFLIMETLADGLRLIDPERRHDVQALLAYPSSEVVALRSSKSADTPAVRRRRSWPLMALAASVAAAVFTGGWLWQILWGWQNFTTAVGEQRAIQLQDNSVVNLNTGSRLRVRFSGTARDIRLIDGEALFSVQHDPRRPFRVYTRDAVIQAVGTQFNVYARAHDTAVAVLEGRVRVAADGHAAEIGAVSAVSDGITALAAGEEADIAHGGKIQRRITVDVTTIAAWRQRRLVFREDSLATIAAEFNRYNRTPQIRLEGLDGTRHHYTGTFDADNPRALALLLSKQEDLRVETLDGEIVIQGKSR